MKKSQLILIIFSFLFLLSQKLSAQDESESSLLWEIKKEGVTNVSYLFGTHHMINESFIDTSKTLNSILENVSTVICEVADLKFDTLEMIKSFILNSNEEYTFKDSAEKKMVSEYLKKEIGSGLEAFINYKPMFLVTFLEIHEHMKLNPYDKATFKGTDMYFMDMARKLGKRFDRI